MLVVSIRYYFINLRDIMKTEYDVSNRLIYLKHELCENCVTRSTLYDILNHRYERGDLDANAYVKRLNKYYTHRKSTN